MYKVFFNDRIVFFIENFLRNFQVNYGLFYKYGDKEELKELLEIFYLQKKIKCLYIFHHNLNKLKDEFKSCFHFIEAAGGLVKNKKGKILFIKRLNKWDLPKGKAEEGESNQQTALREIEEECGIKKLVILNSLQPTYHTYKKKDILILKKTYWYEMYYEGNEPLISPLQENITEVKWIYPKDIQIVLSNTYKSIIDVLKEGKLVSL